MNKKFLGIKISTIIAAAVCLAISFFVWIYVRYDKISSESSLEPYTVEDEI